MEEDFILNASEREKFHRGIGLFNSGEFFRAHEVWEEIWLASSGRARTFLQALIQLAAAFHHDSRQNPAGAKSLLRASLAKLRTFPENFAGIRLCALCQASQTCLDKITKGKSVSNLGAPRIEIMEEVRETKRQRMPRTGTTDQQSEGPSSPCARSHKKRST
jgi:uncharacterized protein